MADCSMTTRGTKCHRTTLQTLQKLQKLQKGTQMNHKASFFLCFASAFIFFSDSFAFFFSCWLREVSRERQACLENALLC
jgi:hypothetical protein